MRVYKVKRGDTLWGIWKKDYSKKMSWDEFKRAVMRLNEGLDPDRIYAGQTINLPDLPGGFLKIASEHPEAFALGSFALGGLFVVAILYLTKKLKI